MLSVEEQEEKVILLSELKDVASSHSKALQMIEKREEYFEDLYHDIKLFSVSYADVTDRRAGTPSVEAQALDIIDAKDAYVRRIENLKRRYTRWRSFLDKFDMATAAVLESYFEKGEGEFPERSTRKVLAVWSEMERLREKESDKVVKSEWNYMQKKHPELFVKKSKKYDYLNDESMTETQSRRYQREEQRKANLQERLARLEKMDNNLLHRANEQRNAL